MFSLAPRWRIKIVAHDTHIENSVNEKMKEFANNAEQSLQRLAQLLDIHLTFGWKSRLSKTLNIKRNTISTWIRRDAIPARAILGIEAAGFTSQMWQSVKSGKSAPQSTKSPRPDPSYGHEPARFGALAGNAPHDDKNPPEKILLQKYVKVLESKVTLLEELLSIRNKHVSELKRIIQGVHPPDGLAERRNCHIDLLEAIARINGIENNDEISASCGGGGVN
jgi:plasmid maintenance system antidote protein VapI